MAPITHWELWSEMVWSNITQYYEIVNYKIMKVFELKNLYFIGLLFGFFLFSCSKEDKAEPPFQHEDAENYYEYTISGAINGNAFGKPDYRSYYSEYVSFYFSKADDHHLSITGLEKYFEDGSGVRHFGIPIVKMSDDSETPELGTYPITKQVKTLRPTDPGYYDILFYAAYKDTKTGRKFGHTGDTEGSITISNSGNGFYEGHFEFEAKESSGSSSETVKIKGKFRQKYKY